MTLAVLNGESILIQFQLIKLTIVSCCHCFNYSVFIPKFSTNSSQMMMKRGTVFNPSAMQVRQMFSDTYPHRQLSYEPSVSKGLHQCYLIVDEWFRQLDIVLRLAWCGCHKKSRTCDCKKVLHPYTSSNISFISFRFFSVCGQSGAKWKNSLYAISWWIIYFSLKGTTLYRQ